MFNVNQNDGFNFYSTEVHIGLVEKLYQFYEYNYKSILLS